MILDILKSPIKMKCDSPMPFILNNFYNMTNSFMKTKDFEKQIILIMINSKIYAFYLKRNILNNLI